MKRFQVIIIIAVLLVQFGCSTLQRQHITQPKIETEASIKKWIKKSHFENKGYTVITVAPEFYWDFDLAASLKISTNPVIYPVNNQNIFYYSGCTQESCMKTLKDFGQNINPLTFAQVDNLKFIRNQNPQGFSFGKMPFQSLAKYFRTLNGEKFILPENSKIDYFLFMPFVKFYGDKMQPEEMKSMIEAFTSNKSAKFKIILLNLDKQEWWGAEWNKKIDFSLNVMK